MQVISVLGALAILGAFAANLFGWIQPSNLWYSVANFLGSAVLTVVAVVDRQLGFILLEGTWALVSLWGIFAALRGEEYATGFALVSTLLSGITVERRRIVAEVKYVSKVKVEPVEGKIRRAYLPVRRTPFSSVSTARSPSTTGSLRKTWNPTTPRSITWSPPRAADCSAPFRARW